MKKLRTISGRGRALWQRTRTKALRRLGFLKGDWAVGLPGELKFWESALKDPGRKWDPGEYRDRTDPDLELQAELKRLIPAAPGDKVRILDVGAGPLTRLGKRWSGREVEIVAVDPLAREYETML